MKTIVSCRPGFVMLLLLSGTAACSDRTVPTGPATSTPIVVVAAPEAPPAPRARVPAPEIEVKVAETSLAESDLIHDSEGEMTAVKRVTDPYRTSDSILADTVADQHGIVNDEPADLGSL